MYAVVPMAALVVMAVVVGVRLRCAALVIWKRVLAQCALAVAAEVSGAHQRPHPALPPPHTNCQRGAPL
jgi:hypothetical protein